MIQQSVRRPEEQMRRKVPFFRPSLSEAEIAEVVACLRTGWLTTGPRTKRFESTFADYVGAKHAVAVNSCTAALHLAVEALGLRPGQAVLVPTMTFAATAEVVRYQGAVPVLVDCDPVTLNMDLDDAERKLQNLRAGRTPLGKDLEPVGIMPVHVGGLMLDMARVQEFAAKHGLWVIEDAAHALPAAFRHTPKGAWRRCGENTAAVTCFSFYANKTMTTGEGGMAVTDDDHLAARIRQMSLHGLSHDAWNRYSGGSSWDYRIVAPGYKYNLTDIASAIGIHQLERADAMRQEREMLAYRFSELLADLGQIELPSDPPHRIHSWHLYPIRLRLERLSISRNEFVDLLREAGVGCSVHWRPLHLHPYYESFGWKSADLPTASAVWERLVSLPLFPGMTEDEQDLVVAAVRHLCSCHAINEDVSRCETFIEPEAQTPVAPCGRIYLSPPHMCENDRSFLVEAFDSNWIAPLGPHVDAFEKEFAQKVGAAHAVAVSSGTAALHLALVLTGIGPGDSVATSTLTFAASANVIRYVGAEPVFIDSDAASWNLDPDLLAEELEACVQRGKPIKAVLAVDVCGQCADFEPIQRLCRFYDIPLIEDAAEALGATYQGKPAGTFGKIGCFSFNGNKIITTSGGGMLVTEHKALADKARFLATQARDPVPHYEHSEIGYNYRMSNLLAAVGRGQLRVLDDRVARRRANFRFYQDALGDLPGIDFMPELKSGRATRWLTCILVNPEVLGATREDIRLALEAENIESRPFWKPMHLQPVYSDCRVRGGAVSEAIFRDGLCLPSGSNLTSEELNRVVDTVRSVGATAMARLPDHAKLAMGTVPR